MNAQEQDPRRDAVEEDRRLQVDPELTEGRARASQIFGVAAAAAVIIVLLLFGLNSGGPGDNVATAPAPQNAPPATAGSEQSNAKTPAAAAQPQGGADQNTGVESGTTQRSSDVDAVGGGSVRNPGSGKVAPPSGQ
jgi:hypothetical protein